MAQNVNGEFGEARREVVPGVNSAAVPKREAQALAQNLVMAPIPASFKAVGDADRAMAEALKWGASEMDAFDKKSKQEDILQGQAMQMQGKTLKELQDEGVSSYTEYGWRLLDAQNTAQKWYATEQEAIDQDTHKLSPEEYRDNLAKRVVGMTEGQDPNSTKLIMAAAVKYNPSVVAYQAKKNMEYREAETFRASTDTIANAKSVQEVSGRDIGKDDWLGTMTMPDSPVAKLSPARYSEALTAGIITAYENDNPLAHKWAQEGGLLDKLNSKQLTAVRSSAHQYQTRQENKFDADYTMARTKLLTDVREGRLDLVSAIEQDRSLKEARGLEYTNRDGQDVVGQATARRGELRSEARAEARADAREAKRDARAAEDAVRLAKFTIANQEDDAAFRRGDLTADQYLDRGVQRAQDLGADIAKATGRLDQDISQAATEAQKGRIDGAIVDRMIATRNFNQPGVQDKHIQLAYRTQAAQSQEKWLDKAARGEVTQEVALASAMDEAMDFRVSTGHKDAALSRLFQEQLLNANPIENGVPKPASAQALYTFVKLYEKNPEFALKHIDAADRPQMLAYAESYNPTSANALNEALQQGQANKMITDADRERYRKQAEGAKGGGWSITDGGPFSSSAKSGAIDSAVKAFMSESVSPAWELRNTLNAGYHRSFREQLASRSDWTTTQNAASANVLRAEITRVATNYLAEGHTRNPEAAVQSAWADVSQRAAIVGGKMIMLAPGSTWGEKLYGTRSAEVAPADVHDGLVHLINVTGERLFERPATERDVVRQRAGEVKIDPGGPVIDTDNPRFVEGQLLPGETGTQEQRDRVPGQSFPAAGGNWQNEGYTIHSTPSRDGMFVRLEYKDGNTSNVHYIAYEDIGKALIEEKKLRNK